MNQSIQHEVSELSLSVGKLIAEDKSQEAQKLQEVAAKAKQAVNQQIHVEEAASRVALDSAIDVCSKLQSTSVIVGLLGSKLEKLTDSEPTSNDLDSALADAAYLMQSLVDEGKHDEAVVIQEVSSTIATLKKAMLRVKVTQSTAAQQEAHTLTLETVAKAEEAAAVLYANGIDVQPLQILAAVANQPGARGWELEAATAAVEVLETELLAQGKLKEAKKAMQVKTLARDAAIRKSQSEEVGMEVQITHAADVCRDLQAKLDLADQFQAAAEVGALAAFIKALPGNQMVSRHVHLVVRQGIYACGWSIDIGHPIFQHFDLLVS